MRVDFDRQVAGIASLADPVRRSLYLFVAHSAEAVSREQAAEGVGVKRALAAFHLDKLADEGLVDVEFRRLTGRTGPGAGRPAKLYRRSDRRIDLSLPPREYDLAARLLAQAIANAEVSRRPVRDELAREALAVGRAMGDEATAAAGRRPSKARQREALMEVLRRHGFEPRREGRDIVLANCPFHDLAQQFTDLVCGMNLQLLRGLRGSASLGDDELQPRLDPEPGQCCVKLRAGAA